MLSYSQRHYDIYISNYSNFVVRVLKIYLLPPVHLLSQNIRKWTNYCVVYSKIYTLNYHGR
jgi:hypothetical protein